jgi:hypothetical protein
MNILFNVNANKKKKISNLVSKFADKCFSLEKTNDTPFIIFQDGVQGSYYIKCSLLAKDIAMLCDLNAKLNFTTKESFRANRELLLKHDTYKKMLSDSSKGREFNDIIVEYNISYVAKKPLKVWGGQHRIRAIIEDGQKENRYHGLKIYFDLNTEQRTEVALISNTNISVSNDTFDRMIEETKFGNVLRLWCQDVGLLKKDQDFPDVGSKSEIITVKKARSFIVNFYLGMEKSKVIDTDQLDQNVYEPYLAKSGIEPDAQYEKIIKSIKKLDYAALKTAGMNFAKLHNVQNEQVRNKKSIKNAKSYRNKALVESVLCGWSYVSGLLQEHPERLNNHYIIPKTNSKILDPLNAVEMSQFKHEQDPPTYRGLGTRSAIKDRQRIAQLFLAKSCNKNVVLDKQLMNKAVSQTVGLLALLKGYGS